MRLSDYLDKGVSLGRDAPCLTIGETTRSYGQVYDDTVTIASALQHTGIDAGDRVAVLSANDPLALTCVFGVSRAGAVWCPINPRNEADENRQLFELFGCRFLFFQSAFADLVARIRDQLPQLEWLVCLDGEVPGALSYDRFGRRSASGRRVVHHRRHRWHHGKAEGRAPDRGEHADLHGFGVDELPLR